MNKENIKERGFVFCNNRCSYCGEDNCCIQGGHKEASSDQLPAQFFLMVEQNSSLLPVERKDVEDDPHICFNCLYPKKKKKYK